MKKVQPHRSLEGAQRALDNGGRLWNVFTHAGDRVITRAEIAAAGGGGGWAGALLYFDLATSELSATERDGLARRLEPKLRRRWAEQRPELVSPGRLDAIEDAKRPHLVEGRARRTAEKTLTTAYLPMTTMIGNVPVTTMTPVTEVFTVFEVEGIDGSVGLVLARKGSTLPDGSRARFGGTVREGKAGKEKSSARRGYLAARYYLPLP